MSLLSFADRHFWNTATRGPALFRERLERLGPLFVKFGQFLALRPDLIPDEYCLELMNLFDRAPTFPWSEARRILREDLGPVVMESFAYIEPVPIAAASLAQVHVARLRGGQDVAIKIQRPGLRDQVLRDLGRARRFLRWSRLPGVSFGMDTDDLVAELTKWMLVEIDFGHELLNLTRHYRQAGSGGDERFPRPYPELSGPRVLTTELMRGIRVTTILTALRTDDQAARASWRASGIDIDRFARSLLNSILSQIFRRRFFHADLHPGNLLLMPDNAVGFVDFGLCDELEERIRQEQMRYFVAVYDHNLDGMYRALQEILIPGEHSDPEAFKRDVHQVMSEWGGISTRDNERPAGERSPIGAAMAGVMRAVRRHDYRIPPRMLSMYRSLLGADTIAYQLCTGVTLQEVGRDFFRDIQEDEVRNSFQPASIERYLLDLHQLLSRSPRQIQQLLSDLAEGRFYLNVNAEERSRSALIRNRRTKMLATSIVSVGLAVLAASQRPFALFDPVLRGVLLAALALTYVWVLVQWRRLG